MTAVTDFSVEVIEIAPQRFNYWLELIFNSSQFARIKDQVGIILVGGAARAMYTGEPIKDFDFAFSDKKSLVLFRDMLLELGATKVSQTYSQIYEGKILCEDMVLTNKHGYAYIQLKHEFYRHPADQFSTADFTVCHFALTFGRRSKLVIGKQGLDDQKNMVLRFHHVSAPLATMIRIPRYIAKGYKPESEVDFYSELITLIRQMPDDSLGFKPKTKAYIAGWEDHVK